MTIELPVPTLEDRARFLTPLKRFTVFAATMTAQALDDASRYYSTFPKVELTSLADRIAYPQTVVIGENAEAVGEILRQAGREIVTTIEPFDNPRYRKGRLLLAFASAIRLWPQLIFIENLDDHSLVRRKALRQEWRNGTNVAGCTVVRNRSQVFERILGNLAIHRSDLTKKNVAAVQVFFEGKDISPDFLTWVGTKRT